MRDDPIMRSLERQDAHYRRSPRALPGEGFTQPYGIEERCELELARKYDREAGLPDRFPREPDDVEPKRTPGHFCHYLHKQCPPFCASELGGCGADDGEDAG